MGKARSAMKVVGLLAVVSLTGCGTVDTLRISSVPAAARLYADGKYLGETPKSVAVRNGLWGLWGDTAYLRLEKDGHQVFERSIPYSERARRYGDGDRIEGTEFGNWGATYPYTFHLQKSE